MTITRDRVFDAMSIAGAVALLIVSIVGPVENLAYTGIGIAIQVMAVGPLICRRIAPLAVIWFTAATAVGMTLAETIAPGTIIDLARDQGTLWIPQAVTPFAVCGAMTHYRSQTAVWIPTGLLFILALRPWDLNGARIATSLLLVIVPAVIGMSIAARDRMYKVLLASARADERAKLAAEMHDVVTHRVSLMVLQAGGLEMTARDAETRRAAEELRANGCQALEELREVVAILREQGGSGTGKMSQAPVPELSTLVSESESVGVPVELHEEGAVGQASAVVRRTAHRIVQEALTNVRKHAPGANVRVHVTYSRTDTKVSVRNSAPVGPGLAMAGSGSGLNNLRERVGMIGGTLDAGPSTEGGFHVSATLTEPTS
ncbi:histidine kinase [Kibdelosporangium philippinense]|uniref:histidine kinase n=1 Tax=Kibdelosporangium philippinense TaxID=211113 RepID=A0ABS8Z488_9PSEU|nr:histidine kinase [Kibdelosporangium philippinense]MCE7002640.1 histidine kinase [Kibdelosporangium philippinense]